MRPRPRLRKTAKWAFTFGAVLAAGVWAGSHFWHVSGSVPFAIEFYLRTGDAEVRRTSANSPFVPPEWRIWRAPTVDYSNAPGFTIVEPEVVAHLPLWVAFLLSAIPTALLWRRDHILTKRARAGRCRSATTTAAA